MSSMTDTVEDDASVDALTLGRRIRAFRIRRGLTLEALASAIDRAPSQVSTIENGNREPRLALLRVDRVGARRDRRRPAGARTAG